MGDLVSIKYEYNYNQDKPIKLIMKPNIKKRSLIYELFSGVGLCNQLFSFETAIYFANILDVKLILIINNPLCHIGRATWDYGYILNFLENHYLYYLKRGFDVYYNNTYEFPKDYYHLKFSDKFSNIVFVDKHLDTIENQRDITEFLNKRSKEILDLDKYKGYNNIYINQSNASRCFYNFYTTEEKYELMNNICKSICFKRVFYEIVNHLRIINQLEERFTLSLHLRFGDKHKDDNFKNRFNAQLNNQILPFIKSHTTNLINPPLYIITDTKTHVFFKNFLKNKCYYLDDIITESKINNILNKYKNHKYIDFIVPKNLSIVCAILQMMVAINTDRFIGTSSSTFSHYINYLRCKSDKSCENYGNISSFQSEYCKLKSVIVSKYPWVQTNYNSGHPTSWHIFWKYPKQLDIVSRKLLTIYGKTDGFGSQLHACLSLIAYCYYNNYEYIHTPIYKITHDQDLSIVNSFINFRHLFKTIDELNSFERSIVSMHIEGPFVHGSFHPAYFYNDCVLNKLRNMYHSSPKPYIEYYSNEYINIAIHIRRGDVSQKNYPSRFTSNATYIDIIKKLIVKLNNNYKIHIFSEGNENDFEDFKEMDILYHLNDDIRNTFHGLVMADYLIIAKSSFSYSAAIFNKNKIVCNLINNWWHKPLEQWITVK